MEAVIAGHPLHPSLIPIPVGLLPASYLLDVLALATNNDQLAEAAYYNMLMGFAGMLPAALTGFSDWQQMEQKDPAHSTATTHGLMNASAMALYGLNLLVRRNNKRSKLGFALSTIGVMGLGVSAYLGGEIAYGRGWRVRSAERFELEWQKQHQKGPFRPEGQPEGSTEEEFPPQIVKAFREKKSGEAVFKDIKEAPTASPLKASSLQSRNGNSQTERTELNRPSTPTPPYGAGSRAEGRPSQAEGEDDAATATGKDMGAQGHPSQAEGDRNLTDTNLNNQPSSNDQS